VIEPYINRVIQGRVILMKSAWKAKYSEKLRDPRDYR
jgi:hypothetical protein